MISLKEKDWPVLNSQSPVMARYVGDSLCVGTKSGDIFNFILKDGKYCQTRRVPVHALQVLSMDVPSDNSYVITTGMDGKCFISTPKDDSFVVDREIECTDLLFPYVAVSPTNRELIALAGKDGHIIVEKSGNAKEYIADKDTFVDLTFFGPNSEYIIAIGRRSLSQIETESGVVIYTLNLETELKRHLHCVAAHPNSKIIACGTFDRFVEFYSIDDQGPQKVFEIAIPDDRVGEKVKLIEKLTFLSDGKTLVVGSSNGSVTLIDIETRSIITSKRFQRLRVFSVAVSPSDHEIVSVSDDQTICCLDVEVN